VLLPTGFFFAIVRRGGRRVVLVRAFVIASPRCEWSRVEKVLRRLVDLVVDLVELSLQSISSLSEC
jgi:hypothetical protein